MQLRIKSIIAMVLEGEYHRYYVNIGVTIGVVIAPANQFPVLTTLMLIKAAWLVDYDHLK